MFIDSQYEVVRFEVPHSNPVFVGEGACDVLHLNNVDMIRDGIPLRNDNNLFSCDFNASCSRRNLVGNKIDSITKEDGVFVPIIAPFVFGYYKAFGIKGFNNVAAIDGKFSYLKKDVRELNGRKLIRANDGTSSVSLSKVLNIYFNAL